MPPEVGAAVIAAVGVIVGAIITSFREEIINFIRRTGRFAFFKGMWQCRWSILAPAGIDPNQVDDQVSIDRVNGALIRGMGSTPGFGRYQLDGRASEFAATLQYCGEGERKDLVGVVILQKRSPLRLEGVWCQYSADGTLKSGTTTWEKIT